jgi:molecular chaperone Hsp33
MKDQDCLRRFLFEDYQVRGVWLNLTTSWQEARQYQTLAPDVIGQLGQALAGAVLLSATIKYKGSLILQCQGSGALKTLVAQCTDDGRIRCLACAEEGVQGESLRAMMHNGRLVITVKPDSGEPYQGVVALDAETMADTLGVYFKNSEQLETRLWLFANANQVSGLLLQVLPGHGEAEDWNHVCVLADTVTEQEMMTLDSESLLFRLFHEDNVRLFDARPIRFDCGCSVQKIQSTLMALGTEELNDIIDQGETLTTVCEFCGADYHFTPAEIEALRDKV